MRILILDDDQDRHLKFRAAFDGAEVVGHVYNARDCIDYLRKYEWDVVFLDHDLGEGFGTGYDVAVWLSENPNLKPPKIFIHSLNPIGALNMQNLLPEAQRYPFAWEHVKLVV